MRISDISFVYHDNRVRGTRPLTIGLSFVRNETDVRQLLRTLRTLGAADDVTVCYKIETHAALASLPLVLVAALDGPPASIMIARGDLASEIGFSDLSSAVDDIIVLAAAAHLPVVFATQVLETLSKTGTPSRSEARSDCSLRLRARARACVCVCVCVCVLLLLLLLLFSSRDDYRI
jgi:hypothetical protein